MVFMPHWPKIIGKKPINLGLDRVEKLMEKLGNPQDNIPPVVHVAGTNGKGSTCAFLKAILNSAGYRVHVYTSPHLVNFNERIVIADKQISDEYLFEVTDECRIAAEGMDITFFEGTTAAAFLAFSKNKADITILETGMGGRLDATNIIKNPLLSVLTTISLDHVEYLGPDISFITREKVGIMKAGTSCISSMQTDEADAIIQDKAAELNCPLYALGYDWMVEKTESGMIYKDNEVEWHLPKPNLFGDHQIINAGNAIASARNLSGFNISKENIINGIQNAYWPARMQHITQGHLLDLVPEGWDIWIDGAHNEAGAQMVACIADDWKDKPLYMICGITKGRDSKTIFSYFKDRADFLCTVTVKTEPSAQKAEHLAEYAREIGMQAQGFADIEEALAFLPTLSDKPARVIFCGSLYLASDAMKINEKNY